MIKRFLPVIMILLLWVGIAIAQTTPRPNNVNGTINNGGGGGGGSGTVSSVSVTTANGISGSVATPTTTPAISLTLGAITPTSVNGIALTNAGSATTFLNGAGAYTIPAGSGGVVSLGTSATVANPQVSGDATTGLYTAGAGSVSFTSAGTHVIDVNATDGINIPLVATSQILSLQGGPFLQNIGSGSTVTLGLGAGAALPTNGLENVFIGENSGNILNEQTAEDVAVGWETLAFSVSPATGNTAVGDGTMWHATTDSNDTALSADGYRNSCQDNNIVSAGRSSFRNVFGSTGDIAIGFAALQGNAASLAFSGSPTTGDVIPFIFTDANLGGGATTVNYTVTSSDTTIALLTAHVQVALNAAGLGDGIGVLASNAAYNNILSVDHPGNSTIPCGSTATMTVTIGTITGAATEVVAVTNGATGTLNAFIGEQSGQGFGMTTASSNDGFGFDTLAGLTTGSNNVAVGNQALFLTTTGIGNVAIGLQALENNTTGGSNTGVGIQALLTATGATSSDTAVGATALEFATGNQNVGIGTGAGKNISTGGSNIVIGNGVGSVTNSLTGSFNTVTGINTATGLTGAAAQNSLYGSSAALTTGSDNSIFGFQAGNALTTANNNTFLGWDVGRTTCQTGNSNILIGVSSAIDCAATTTTNTINIGGSGGSWVLVTGTSVNSTEATTMNGTLAVTGALTASTLNGVALTTGGSSTTFLNAAGAYTTPAGGGGTATIGTSATITSPNVSGDLTTGLFSTASGTVSFSSAGTDVIDISSTDGINMPLVTTSQIMSIAGAPFLQNLNSGNSLTLGIGAGVNLPSNAFDDVFIGSNSGQTTTAINQENTGVGFSTLQYSTSAGSGNTAVGAGAMWHTTTDTQGVGIGADDQRDGCQGINNTSVGRQAFRSFFGSTNNTVIGESAGFGNAASLALSGSPTTGDTIPITFTDANLSGGFTTITYTVTSSDTTNPLLATHLTTFIIAAGLGDGISAAGIGIANNGVVAIEHPGNNTIACGGTPTMTVTVGTIGGAGTEIVTVGNGATAGNNTFAGYEAGFGAAMTSASNNAGFGYGSLSALSTGTQNDASGFESLFQNTSGAGNTAHGYVALTANTTGNDNTAVGDNALASETTTASNTAIGYLDLSFANGNSNTGVGATTGRNVSTGANNTFLGSGIASGATNALTGAFNVIVGSNNAPNITGIGADNVLVGASNAIALTTGIGNTISGFQAGNAITTTNTNTAYGYHTLTLATGANNTAIGQSVASTTLVTGNNNLLLGVGAVTVAGGSDVPTSSTSNYLNIGNMLEGSMMNANAITKETLFLTSAANSVNYVQITGGATGTGPTISAAGTDTNIQLNISTTGAGLINAQASIVHAGTKFTASGCSNSTTVGGSDAGSFASGITGACTVVLTLSGATGATAPNGWTCRATDLTTVPALFTGLFAQTATTQTTATISGTTVSADVISFNCTAY